MLLQNSSFSVNLKLVVASIYLINTVSFAATQIQNESNITPDPAVILATDPELKNYFIKMEDFADQLQKSESPNTSIFGLKGQRIEILNQEGVRVHSLEKGQIEMTKPAFTLLKYSKNDQTKEFVIEAISGADEKGNNGKVVAKHILTGYDVATVIADNLLVVIVEKNGNVSVIPKSMIISLWF